MWQSVTDSLKVALFSGNPPLYLQLMVATGIFLLLRFYIWWKNRKVRKLTFLQPQWVTGAWLLSIVALSFGAYHMLQGFYEDHLLRLYRIFHSLV